MEEVAWRQRIKLLVPKRELNLVEEPSQERSLRRRPCVDGGSEILVLGVGHPEVVSSEPTERRESFEKPDQVKPGFFLVVRSIIAPNSK